MMNRYTLAYTIFDPTKPKQPPAHKKFSFESENDMLAAADEGMCIVFDKYEAGTTNQLLFRSITLDNAHEIYKGLIQEAQRNAEAATSN